MKIDKLKARLNKKLATKVVALKKDLLSNELVADTLQVFTDATDKFRASVKEEMSQWFWSGWNMTAYTEAERQLLKYYYPLVPAIQSIEQKAHCLSTAFNMPFRLEERNNRYKTDQPEYFLKEGDFFEYGRPASTRPAYAKLALLVEIGPIASSQLADWAPGGGIRCFLEKVFLPMILQVPATLEIRLLIGEYTDRTECKETDSFWELNFHPS